MVHFTINILESGILLYYPFYKQIINIGIISCVDYHKLKFHLVGHHWTLRTLLLCVKVTTGFSKCLESHKTILLSLYDTIWLLLYTAISIPFTARVWVVFVDLDAS